MMQEEWDDCSLFFFLWGEGKKSFKIIRRDEDRRDKENKSHLLRPGRRLLVERRGSISHQHARDEPGPGGTNSLIHSLTHTTNTTSTACQGYHRQAPRGTGARGAGRELLKVPHNVPIRRHLALL